MRALLMAVAVMVAASMVAVGAAADGGGPSPGVSWGWDGVVAPGGKVRYVAIPGNRDTLVEAVRMRGGRILRWTSIPGTYGVPLVASDGSAGGLSNDGKTLVLTDGASPPGPHTTTLFVPVRTRTLTPRRPVIVLPGSFSFDALSPDASTLYLIQYSSARNYNRYRVRAYDLVAHKLLPGAIVDRREPDEVMAGVPVTRATTADGQWAYTLYARSSKPPFVHALDTMGREAFCIDLPLHLDQQQQMRLRLALDGTQELRVRSGRTTVAVVDMQKLEARKGA